MNLTLNKKRTCMKALYILLYVPFFEPGYFVHTMKSVDILYSLLYALSLIIIAFLYFYDMIRGKAAITPPIIFIAVYSLILIFSSFVSDVLVLASVKEGIKWLALAMLTDMLMRRSLKDFLDAVYPIFFILTIVNFISMLLSPEGLYLSVVKEIVRDNKYGAWYSYNSFLGYENTHIFYFIPTALFSYINLVIRKKKIDYFHSILITIVCILSVLLKFKAGAVITATVFFVLCYLALTNKLPKISNSISYLSINVGMFVGIVLLRLQNLFAFFIENILHKNLTLTNRTSIWDKALKCISQNPLLGVGFEETADTVSTLGYNSTHSQYLWMLYRGGILQLTVFLWYIVKVTKKLYAMREHKIAQITAIAICSLLIAWQSEAITASPIILLLVFSYYTNSFVMKES